MKENEDTTVSVNILKILKEHKTVFGHMWKQYLKARSHYLSGQQSFPARSPREGRGVIM